jgi:hypothetical protein
LDLIVSLFDSKCFALSRYEAGRDRLVRRSLTEPL